MLTLNLLFPLGVSLFFSAGVSSVAAIFFLSKSRGGSTDLNADFASLFLIYAYLVASLIMFKLCYFEISRNNYLSNLLGASSRVDLVKTSRLSMIISPIS